VSSQVSKLVSSELTRVNSFIHALHDNAPRITRLSRFSQVIILLGVILTKESLEPALKTRESKFTDVITKLNSLLPFFLLKIEILLLYECFLRVSYIGCICESRHVSLKATSKLEVSLSSKTFC